MNWISVKERLPTETEYYETLLLYDSATDYICDGFFFEDHVFMIDSDEDEEDIEEYEPTHWINFKDIPKPKDKS